jgi:hypothetical protein
VYGRRHKPYGNKNFPSERLELDRLVVEADENIHAIAKSQAVSR